MSIFAKLRLASESPSDLKLGYFTSLTIIAERNNSSTGSANTQFTVPRILFPFDPQHDEQRQRRDQSGGGGNREAEKFLAARAAVHRREAIESRQPERAANQINRGDEPADLRMRHKNSRSTMRCTRNAGAAPKEIEVGERIEFAPERTFISAHARDAAIEQIKNAREQNQEQARVLMAWMKLSDVRVGLDDFCERDETAEQISRRQQVRQKINLQLVAFVVAAVFVESVRSF